MQEIKDCYKDDCSVLWPRIRYMYGLNSKPYSPCQELQTNIDMELIIVRKEFEMWVHKSGSDEVILYGMWSSKSPMSNFYKLENGFDFGGKKWHTAEHAIMWSKAMLFGDEETAVKIEQSPHAFQAKHFGRQVKGFNESIWRDWCNENVPLILKAKFGSEQYLRWWLTSLTKNGRLAEMAREDEQRHIVYSDSIWGIGIGAHHPDADDPSKWSKWGKNYLGKYTEEAREMLRADLKKSCSLL